MHTSYLKRTSSTNLSKRCNPFISGYVGPNIFFGVALVRTQEQCSFQLFPEVMWCDVTWQTNTVHFLLSLRGILPQEKLSWLYWHFCLLKDCGLTHGYGLLLVLGYLELTMLQGTKFVFLMVTTTFTMILIQQGQSLPKEHAWPMSISSCLATITENSAPQQRPGECQEGTYHF